MKKVKIRKSRNYVIAVNECIPFAEMRATKRYNEAKKLGIPLDRLVKGYKGSVYEHDTWTEYFHKSMNEICKERGIRG